MEAYAGDAVDAPVGLAATNFVCIPHYTVSQTLAHALAHFPL